MARLALAALFFLAGCAALQPGHDLVPGQSTEDQVVAEMGAPSLALDEAGGGKALYFSREPFGRAIYKATIGPGGGLRAFEQTLTPENLRKIRVNESTKDQVRELLGPPYRADRAPFKPYEVWEYWWRIVEDRRILWVSFSDDGVVREVTEMHDYASDPPSGPTRAK